MQHALRERGDEEEIVSSILKFLSSLVLNKELRIDYCNALANGVTLFKETSRVIQVYGNVLLENFKSFVGIGSGRHNRPNVPILCIKGFASYSM